MENLCSGFRRSRRGAGWVASQMATLEIAAPFVTVALERAAVEQGQKTEIFGKVTTSPPVRGECQNPNRRITAFGRSPREGNQQGDS